MNFGQQILPKGQKRRSKGFEKSGFELDCNRKKITIQI